MKKINLNPSPKPTKKKLPIELDYHGWKITIDKLNNMYHFLGSRLWTKNNVIAITRSYSSKADLKKCLTTFKAVLDNEIKTKEQVNYDLRLSRNY